MVKLELIRGYKLQIPWTLLLGEPSHLFFQGTCWFVETHHFLGDFIFSQDWFEPNKVISHIKKGSLTPLTLERNPTKSAMENRSFLPYNDNSSMAIKMVAFSDLDNTKAPSKKLVKENVKAPLSANLEDRQLSIPLSMVHNDFEDIPENFLELTHVDNLSKTYIILENFLLISNEGQDYARRMTQLFTIYLEYEVFYATFVLCFG